MMKATREFKEDDDCCVVSLAHACGVPYGVAHEACRLSGRMHGDGMYPSEVREAIKRLGYKQTAIRCQSKTLRTLFRNIKHRGAFVVMVGDHLTSIKNKETWDTGHIRSCKRIEVVYLIEKNEIA